MKLTQKLERRSSGLSRKYKGDSKEATLTAAVYKRNSKLKASESWSMNYKNVIVRQANAKSLHCGYYMLQCQVLPRIMIFTA